MRKVLALSICALAFVAGAYAQATAGLGSVSGTVRDATGAVIPGATVVVANDEKGIKRTMSSTDAGVFAAPALVPSPGYKITVTKQGFADYEIKDFTILVDQNVDFRVSLQIGSATTKVDVSAEAPLVEDTKSGVTATVGSDQIDSLPINGRQVDSFVLLTPAVTNDGDHMAILTAGQFECLRQPVSVGKRRGRMRRLDPVMLAFCARRMPRQGSWSPVHPAKVILCAGTRRRGWLAR